MPTPVRIAVVEPQKALGKCSLLTLWWPRDLDHDFVGSRTVNCKFASLHASGCQRQLDFQGNPLRGRNDVVPPHDDREGRTEAYATGDAATFGS
jgi:hypothetical protein